MSKMLGFTGEDMYKRMRWVQQVSCKVKKVTGLACQSEHLSWGRREGFQEKVMHEENS